MLVNEGLIDLVRSWAETSRLPTAVNPARYLIRYQQACCDWEQYTTADNVSSACRDIEPYLATAFPSRRAMTVGAASATNVLTAHSNPSTSPWAALGRIGRTEDGVVRGKGNSCNVG